MLLTRFLLHVAVVFFAALFASTAIAQFPTKPIRFIIPYASGGSSDIVARSVADKATSEAGQPVIVDYKPGANGSIGTEYVAKSEADGYTLLIATLSHVTTPSLFLNLPWHPTRNFSGVALLGTVPAVAVVHPSIPATTLKEFVDFAKRNPKKLNYLSPGRGTSMHLNAELLNLVAGIDIAAVLYKGTAPGIPDLLSNRISLAFLPVSLTVGYIKAAKLKPLFIASAKRNSQLPDVPTAVEAGYSDAQVVSWFALLAPANTPRDRVEYLNKIINVALSSPEVEKKMDGGGVSSVSPMTPHQVDEMLVAETARYAKLMKDAKIEPQ